MRTKPAIDVRNRKNLAALIWKMKDKASSIYMCKDRRKLGLSQSYKTNMTRAVLFQIEKKISITYTCKNGSKKKKIIDL